MGVIFVIVDELERSDEVVVIEGELNVKVAEDSMLLFHGNAPNYVFHVCGVKEFGSKETRVNIS